MIKVLVLDFDGVIVDSLPIRDEGFKYAFLPYGEEIAAEAKKFHVEHRGIFRHEKFKRIYQTVLKVEASDEQLATAEQRFFDYTHNRLINVEFFPGISELSLLRDSIPVYIVSAAPYEEIVCILRKHRILKMFSGVFGGPKTKIHYLNYILKKYDCASSSLLFVGDAYKDYEAANTVGAHFFGISQSADESPFPDVVRVFPSLRESVLYAESNNYFNGASM